MKPVNLLFVLFLVSLVFVAQARPLIVGFHDWAPNQFLAENHEARGVDIELTRAIFRQAEIDIEFRHYPWKRILYLLERGQVDIAMSAGFTQERSEFARYSGEVYRVGQNAMFIRRESQPQYQHVRSLADLRSMGIKLGVTLGSSYSDEFEQLLEDRNFMRLLNIYENDRTKFELLARGRLDAILAGKDIGSAWIKQLELQDDIIHHMDLYPREQGETWLMFSKISVSQKLVEQVDEAIKTLRASGTLDKILTESQLLLSFEDECQCAK